MKSYKANEIFQLTESGNFPLNCQFVPKTPSPPALDMPGIYMLFFDQEIVYIGLADNQPALERIQMQLSTITLRGNKVSFNDTGKVIVQSSTILSSQFTRAINQNNARFETSPNRVKFAASKWELFSRLNEEILSRFVIVWFPENKCKDESLLEIRNRWVRDLKPICNG